MADPQHRYGLVAIVTSLIGVANDTTTLPSFSLHFLRRVEYALLYYFFFRSVGLEAGSEQRHPRVVRGQDAQNGQPRDEAPGNGLAAGGTMLQFVKVERRSLERRCVRGVEGGL
jgi:hypothetical protein